MEIVLLNCDMFTNLIIYVTQRIYSYTSITNTRRAVCKKLNRPVVMVYSVFYFRNIMIRYKYFKKSNRTEEKNSKCIFIKYKFKFGMSLDHALSLTITNAVGNSQEIGQNATNIL